MRYAPQPQVSGAMGGRTLSYHEFARMGVTLLGRLRSAAGNTLLFDDDLVANVEFADAFSKRICSIFDGYIERDGIEAPPAERTRPSAPSRRCLRVVRRLNWTSSRRASAA
ncbi:MAG: hypothetical protein O3B31_08755 [Chloroflexi bacterium]|nr:hypothetical protein [Chloroflexota bacterium]MDA1003416.1 hypothetical protein [Chloroflexota bacterium]